MHTYFTYTHMCVFVCIDTTHISLLKTSVYTSINMGFGAVGRFGAGTARSHVARHTGNDQLEPANVNRCLA